MLLEEHGCKIRRRFAEVHSTFRNRVFFFFFATRSFTYTTNPPSIMFTRPSSHQTALRIFTSATRKSSSTSITPSPTTPPKPTTRTKYTNLQSFLSNTSATRTDAVYKGTKYEYTVQSSLSRLGFTLAHNGGSFDYGIDLLGTWTLPSSPTPLKVLIQCKSQAQKVSPAIIRELEGMFIGAPVGWRGPGGVMALLACRRPATKGVREAMGRSRWPMGYVLCEDDGRVLQMLWNKRARRWVSSGITWYRYVWD